MSTIHQRGIGQVLPLCRASEAPLGLVRGWDVVTCLPCATVAFRDFLPRFVVAMEDLTSGVRAFIDAWNHRVW